MHVLLALTEKVTPDNVLATLAVYCGKSVKVIKSLWFASQQLVGVSKLCPNLTLLTSKQALVCSNIRVMVWH